MQIARSDTGAGGLAGVSGLTGKDVPIVRWQDFADQEDPDRVLPSALGSSFTANAAGSWTGLK